MGGGGGKYFSMLHKNIPTHPWSSGRGVEGCNLQGGGRVVVIEAVVWGRVVE